LIDTGRLAARCLAANGSRFILAQDGDPSYGHSRNTPNSQPLRHAHLAAPARQSARWLLDGQQVSPAIAKYLMHEGLLGDVGATELGARKLVLTTAGVQFRERGMRWWSALGPLQKLGVMIRG